MAFLIPMAAAAGSAIAGVVGSMSLGSALTAGAGLLSAAGALKQGQAASSAAKYNAQIQQQQANAELDQAGARATEMATRTRQKVAATRSAALQNGFETDGSVADILSVVETQGALEGLTALYDGTTRAQGLRNSAELNRANAKSATTFGYLNAGTSLLSGFSKAYSGGSSA